MCQHYRESKSFKHVKNLMSAFVDLEAGVNCEEVLKASPSTVAPVLGIPEQEKMWTDLLERATLRATRVSAAFIMPLLEKQVWLEVEMSYTLKAWLKDIPGVRLCNQQPILHALSPLDGFGALLSTNSSKPLVIGKSKGDTGMVGKVYPWGCKVLLIPRLDPSARDKKHGKRQRLDDNLAPKLFNRGAIELDGSEKLKVLNKERNGISGMICFSQVEMAHEIPDSLAGLFAQSRHPLVRRYRQKLPRISEWCLVVGDPIMDTSSGRVGLVGSVEDHGCGMRKVHPNLVMVSTPPLSLPLPLKKDQDPIHHTKECPWKGTLVLIVRCNHCWHGKTGYVEDAIVINNPSGKPVLSLLVRLASYDPNMPYPTLWFEYLDVVNEESYLPLNEALPLADNDDNLYHKHVPTPYVLEEKVSVQNIKGSTSVAAVRVKLNGSDGLKCVREDTSLHEELDPAVVLPIHPTARHYDMFLVISGEHCGKWVRGIQYKKILPKDRSDLEWMVAVVIPRTPFMHDDLTDERLVLHSSCMTLADETAISPNLNENLRRQLLETCSRVLIWTINHVGHIME
ncbi:hypothetical protein IW261DRAFT_1423174 [Armillaria novae-zelandiae]|uniref:Uncharacterized protein n=1 Tax=Armillaria novae-zelandiae TaxID=153914 RepID=A0AA39NY71_9AGAR|nr:hypothetical protein IW261DRAFT_1423174 [Armillaria novae-zelandiae]